MEITKKHGPQIPSDLTCSQAKKDLFATDTYFWEGWEDLLSIAQDKSRSLSFNHALLLLKPDAIVKRNLYSAFEWLKKSGFHIVWAQKCFLTRHTIRVLWQ